MPKKKSGKRAAKEFEARLDEIEDFLADINAANLAAASVSRCYESAVIRTAIAFEKLMLSCLVTAINNDTSMLSQTTGIQFPKHLTDEVCEFLVVGDGYFDFRGWDGLLKVSKQFRRRYALARVDTQVQTILQKNSESALHTSKLHGS